MNDVRQSYGIKLREVVALGAIGLGFLAELTYVAVVFVLPAMVIE